MAPPLVDLAVLTHPAQSESVNDVTLVGMSCQTNLDTNLGLPIKYLPILRSLLMAEALGALMPLADSLTAYAISGLSGAM